MLADVGHFSLLAALFFSFVQTGGALIGSRRNNNALVLLSRQCQVFVAILMTLAFGTLVYAYCISDFSVANVALNSHTLKPFVYKIAGAWSNHEGSMVLWCWLLSMIGCRLGSLSGLYGLLNVLFISFTFFTSSPFVELVPAPQEGLGLNPLLQHIGLALHPPFLYAGYLLFSVPYVKALDQLIHQHTSYDVISRRFSLLAWSTLTIGITLGSWWAYQELGWGGWWFWDPVENASLFPWLSGLMLIHTLVAHKKTKVLQRWRLFLSLTTFSLCILGLFLVRSGVMVSVHSFTNDPTRGLFILGILSIIAGGGLFLFLHNSRRLPSTPDMTLPTREGSVLLNNLFTCVALLTVMLGTLLPLFADNLYGHSVTIGPSYYQITFVPLSLAILTFMIIVPELKWLKESTLSTFMRSVAVILVAYGIIYFIYRIDLIKWIAITIAIGIIITSVRRFVLLSRTTNALKTEIGFLLAHFGFGIALIGIIGSTLFQIEVNATLSPQNSLNVGSYTYTFDSVAVRTGKNYVGETGQFSVRTKAGDLVTILHPENRYYPVENQNTSEADIHNGLFQDLYAVFAKTPVSGRNTYDIRIYHNPCMGWLWAGMLIIAIGGYYSASKAK